MNTKYLSQELKKWLLLQDRMSNTFLDKFNGDKDQFNYITNKAIPAIEKDLNFQTDLIVKEAERLLKKYEDEKNKQTKANK